jgi:DNA polymerase I-like protein with 3'-5' exonuclease and polymerase domains
LPQESFFATAPEIRFPAWVETADYKVVTTQNAVEAFKEIVDAPVVAWDSEFKPTHNGHVVHAFSFCTKPGSGWVIPVRMEHIPNLDVDLVKKFILAISKKRNVCQQSRAEMRSVAGEWPLEWEDMVNITDDVAVIWYLKDVNEAKDFSENRPAKRGAPQPQGFALEMMSLKYLKLEMPSLKKYFEGGGTFAELEPEIARKYACCDADITLRLYEKGMDQALNDSFSYRIDMASLVVLLEMEMRGILLDPETLFDVRDKVGVHLKVRRKVAYEKLKMDQSINIDSHKQLARHIYNTLSWPIMGKKKKDGLGGTDKNTIGRFAESSDPEIAAGAQAIRDYKQFKTLHNNFLTTLHEYVNPSTGAIHCSFKSTVVPTGRLACGSPNMQQIPRSKEAPARRAFPARPGKLFFEADFSQIELRVYASESGEDYLIDAFETGEDLHLKTASVIFREQITDKGDDRRQMGKTMNFGPIYGMKPEGLAMRTDYSLDEAQRILDDFFAAMPDATAWTQRTVAKAKQMGGVHTHFQRWRPLPWLNSRIPSEVAFGERSAINTIVQGTAADIMKIALVRIWKALRKDDCPYPDCKMVLTIHDSVLFEVPADLDLAAFFEWLKGIMCFPIEGYVPLEIDAKVGPNWLDMQELNDWLGIDEADIPKTKAEPVEKEIAVPDMPEEKRREFVELLKQTDHSGDMTVHFLKVGGEKFSTLTMTPPDYQMILRFLIDLRKAKQDEPSAETAAEKVAVSFS